MDKDCYFKIKQEIEDILDSISYETICESNLYRVDLKIIQKLREFDRKLELEYASSLNYKKEFSLPTMVKIINPYESSHYYTLYKRERWEQVNDPEKVRNRLDGKFVKWKNTLKKNILEKCKEEKLDKKNIDKIMVNINNEIIEAEKKLSFIKENFDNLDVRISGYAHRIAYGSISYKTGKKQNNQVLRVTVPNILWFEEQTEDEKIRTDNELVRYIKKAKIAFGDIYYLEK